MKPVPAAQVHATLAKHYPSHVLGWVKRATWHAHPGVPLSRIDMSRRPGARDPKKVEGIAQAVKDGKPMPPVVLVNTGEAKLQIADGYHRTLGFEHAGKTKIPALIASGVGAHGPWEKRMHAAKLNLTAEHTHVLDLAGVCTGSGPCVTTPTGTGNNWVTRAGGLPDYVRALVNAFKRKGVPESVAVQRAIGVLQNWASGRGNVSAATRARAAAAIAEWNALKAKAHSLTASPTAPVDLATTVTSTNDMPTLTVPARMAAASKGQALPGGRFPIRNLDELRKAIRAVGRAKGDHAAVRRFIIRRAKELGGTNLIPEQWHADGTVDMTATSAATVDLAFTEGLHPRGKKGTAQGGKFVAKNSSDSGSSPAGDTRDFQRRTGLKQTGSYDAATAAKVNALLNPKTGGGHGKGKARHGKRKGGTSSGGTSAKQTAAHRRANAARTAVAVNKLTPAQRELFRASHPTPPPGYRWNAAGMLVAVATNPQARRVRAILAKP